MSKKKEAMTPEQARSFQRRGRITPMIVRTTLTCGCQPYKDVFTLPRWNAQGFKVKKGEKALRLPLVREDAVEDEETGETTNVRHFGSSKVFCRCQVEPMSDKRTPQRRSKASGR